MAYIYKITNDINNKFYIGKTEYANPEKRWKEHLSDYKKRKCEKRPLYAAMNKYGTEHFHFEVIEETDSPEEREKYWIKKLRTYVGYDDCNGYNATLGGDGSSYLNLNEDEVVRYHIEEASYIVGETAKHFNVAHKTITTILKKKNIFWLKHQDVTRLMTYEKYGGIFQVDNKSRIILNVFENISEASLHINKEPCKNHIYSACNGYHKGSHFAYGYLWYYGKDISEAIENGEVVQIDKIYEKYCNIE